MTVYRILFQYSRDPKLILGKAAAGQNIRPMICDHLLEISSGGDN